MVPETPTENHTRNGTRDCLYGIAIGGAQQQHPKHSGASREQGAWPRVRDMRPPARLDTGASAPMPCDGRGDAQASRPQPVWPRPALPTVLMPVSCVPSILRPRRVESDPFPLVFGSLPHAQRPSTAVALRRRRVATHTGCAARRRLRDRASAAGLARADDGPTR